MAAAEVRAAWQRTANRCFVQEDAKRAPKLACCQPPCAAPRPADAGPANAADEPDHAAANATPFNRKSSSRWWLHLQPNYGFQEGPTREEPNALEDEVEISEASDENKACKGDATHHHDSPADVMRKTPKERMQGACGKNSQALDAMAKLDTLEIDSDHSWIEEGGEARPWWRTTDRDELASFVSRRSPDRIENCDLPPPRKFLRGQPRAGAASLDLEAKSSGFSKLSAGLADIRDPCLAREKSSSYTTIREGDPSKAQLMEALRRSQTRAREAEAAAKRARAERERLVTLFFKQASQLFAHKLWLRLLLLENLHVEDQPAALPLKRKHRFDGGEQGLAGDAKGVITTCAVAFALGFSLVGAGLLLGWSVGWMLPRL